jgi:hypothetical protein
MTLADLRKQRSNDFSSITAALTKKTEYAKDDEGFWKPTKDKAGNASATIRFLPKTKGDELPWVQVYTHAFQGPTGKWYIENCLSTIGQDDPVLIENKKLYATGLEADKKEALKRKRKLHYIANILVINDPANPENNNKVFYFKFGKKIFEKIMDKIQPTFEDEAPSNVFDLWEGSNFKLRMRQVEGYPNYDTSTFAEPSQIADTDEEILEIVNQQKPLAPFVAKDKFKSFEDLEKKMRMVLSNGPVGNVKNAADQLKDELDEAAAPAPKVSAPKAKETPPPAAPKAKPASKDEDDDLADYFASLAND